MVREYTSEEIEQATQVMTSFTLEENFHKLHAKEFVKYFGEVTEDKKAAPHFLEEGLEHLIKDYEAFQPRSIEDIKKMMQHQTDYSDDIVQELAKNNMRTPFFEADSFEEA